MPQVADAETPPKKHRTSLLSLPTRLIAKKEAYTRGVNGQQKPLANTLHFLVTFGHCRLTHEQLDEYKSCIDEGYAQGEIVREIRREQEDQRHERMVVL